MKKSLIFAFLLILVLGLGGCSLLGLGGKTGDSKDGDTNPNLGTGLSGTIATGHWTANTYVSDSITVTGSLTIDPGVTVTFADNTYLAVDAGASLSAIGTAAKPIVFTAVNNSTYWRALYLNGTNTTLKYVSINRAGNSAYSHPAVYFYTNGATADIENCTVAGNLFGGVDASSAGIGTVIKSNAFFNNGASAFGLTVNDRVDLGSVAAASANTYTNSGYATTMYNDIYFKDDIASTRTFDVTEVPYYFGSSAAIAASGQLTITSGVSLDFADNTYLAVDAGASLSAIGTAAKPIVFTAVNNSTYWRALYLNGTNTTLKYVSINRAGNSAYSHPAVYFYTNGATADIENCTVTGNLFGGVDASSAGIGTVIKSNAFFNNGASAFGLTVNDRVDLGSVAAASANTYTNSGYATTMYNDIYFKDDIASTRTFDVTEVPYYFGSSAAIAASGQLTITSGVSLDFADNTYLAVDAGASLSAIGTAAKPIVFTAVNNSTYWRALYLNGTNTILKYVSINRAGNSAYSHPAVYFYTNGATADIENCTVTGNLFGGVDASSAGIGTVISTNSFGNNGDDGASVYDLVISGAVVTANGNAAIAGTNSFTVQP